MAVSASRSRSSGFSWPVVPSAMPMLTVEKISCPSMVYAGR
jgi:hypothetical protein